MTWSKHFTMCQHCYFCLIKTASYFSGIFYLAIVLFYLSLLPSLVTNIGGTIRIQGPLIPLQVCARFIFNICYH